MMQPSPQAQASSSLPQSHESANKTNTVSGAEEPGADGCLSLNPTLLRSRQSTLIPGYTQVEAFDDSEEYVSDEEETVYVTLDLGNIEPTLVSSSSSYKLIGLDTPTPYLQLSGTILRGAHNSLLGTELLFTDDNNQEVHDWNKRTLVHVGNTSQRITFKEVRLRPKEQPPDSPDRENGDEELMDMDSGPELEEPALADTTTTTTTTTKPPQPGPSTVTAPSKSPGKGKARSSTATATATTTTTSSTTAKPKYKSKPRTLQQQQLSSSITAADAPDTAPPAAPAPIPLSSRQPQGPPGAAAASAPLASAPSIPTSALSSASTSTLLTPASQSPRKGKNKGHEEATTGKENVKVKIKVKGRGKGKVGGKGRGDEKGKGKQSDRNDGDGDNTTGGEDEDEGEYERGGEEGEEEEEEKEVDNNDNDNDNGGEEMDVDRNEGVDEARTGKWVAGAAGSPSSDMVGVDDARASAVPLSETQSLSASARPPLVSPLDFITGKYVPVDGRTREGRKAKSSGKKAVRIEEAPNSTTRDKDEDVEMVEES